MVVAYKNLIQFLDDIGILNFCILYTSCNSLIIVLFWTQSLVIAAFFSYFMASYVANLLIRSYVTVLLSACNFRLKKCPASLQSTEHPLWSFIA